MDYTVLDIETWNRKEIYQFFKTFEEPFTGFTADVDVTIALRKAKELGVSFFSYYLHKSLCAVNGVGAFRLRIIDDQVRLYDEVHASATLSRQNGTFGFSNIAFDKDLAIFAANIEGEKERVQNSESLFPPDLFDAVVHYSSVPWIQFTSVQHARKYSISDSSPKISFGKVYKSHDQVLMPTSVHAHHAVVDGRDIGAFFELFQKLLNE